MAGAYPVLVWGAEHWQLLNVAYPGRAVASGFLAGLVVLYQDQKSGGFAFWQFAPGRATDQVRKILHRNFEQQPLSLVYWLSTGHYSVDPFFSRRAVRSRSGR